MKIAVVRLRKDDRPLVSTIAGSRKRRVALNWRLIAGAIVLTTGFTTHSASYSTELSSSAPQTAPQSQQKETQSGQIRPFTICPTEVEPLLQALLRDLPEYVNRVRHQRGGSQAYQYAIVASQANLEPLPVVTSTPDPQQGGLHQSFFTLLERQYDTRQVSVYQQYHWLFLANTERGWQLALLYSRTGSYPSYNEVPSPLRDATQEATGRAIRLWLRDCRAGAIKLVNE